MSSPAFSGPYVLAGTLRDVTGQTVVPGVELTGGLNKPTTVYNDAATNFAGVTSTAPYPSAPTAWKLGRDFYSTGGFLNG